MSTTLLHSCLFLPHPAMSPCFFPSLSLPLFQSLSWAALCSDAVNRPLAWLQTLLPNRHKSSLERKRPAGWCAALLKELSYPREWWRDARQQERKLNHRASLENTYAKRTVLWDRWVNVMATPLIKYSQWKDEFSSNSQTVQIYLDKFYMWYHSIAGI